MRESDTYLAILDEGAIVELKKVILWLGQQSLGSPSESVAARLAAMEDLEHLERIVKLTNSVKTWEELLETP